MRELGYPEPRERETRAAGGEPKGYTRYEDISALAGTGGTFPELGRFSGTPDAIDLLTTGGDALVRLTDELDREESNIRLITGVQYITHISRRIIRASNVSDAAPATVRATGKWLG